MCVKTDGLFLDLPQSVLPPLSNSRPAAADVPALRALVCLYYQHFEPQSLKVTSYQRELTAKLAPIDAAASAAAAAVSQAASAAAVATRNMELVRNMQADAEVLATRLERLCAVVAASNASSSGCSPH